MSLKQTEKIILFDGVCNLCNGFVQFVIRIDKHKIFKFSSLQSDYAQKILNTNNLHPKDFNSFLFIDNGVTHQKSNAALAVCKNIGGAWKLLYILKIVPKPIRDWVYDLIAKNRYKWFGKQESCMLPSLELKSRFI